jgi:hypothetical protein
MLEAHASGQQGLIGSLWLMGGTAASGRSAAAATPAITAIASARVAPPLAARPHGGDEIYLLSIRLHHGDGRGTRTRVVV